MLVSGCRNSSYMNWLAATRNGNGQTQIATAGILKMIAHDVCFDAYFLQRRLDEVASWVFSAE